MKKIFFLVFLFLGFQSSYALDISAKTDSNQNAKKDTGMSMKKGQDVKENESQKTSESTSKEKSKTNTDELTKIGEMEVLQKIAEFELNGVYPFKKCLILSSPKSGEDFGITGATGRGQIDTIKLDVLEKAAKGSGFLKTVRSIKENDIKNQINCIAFYGGIISQSIKSGKIDTDLYDEEIKTIFKKTQESLAKNDCRFDKSQENIMCGGVKYTMGYEPLVSFSSIPLFKENTFYGYKLSQNKSVAVSEKLSQEISKAKERSVGTSQNIEFTMNSGQGQELSKGISSSFSPSNWMPK